MVDLIVYAIPAFVALLAIEAVSFRAAAREELKGYEARHRHEPPWGSAT